MKRIILAILLMLVGIFSAEAAPTVTVTATSITIIGTNQTISLTCSLVDPNQTGVLRSGGTVLTNFSTSTTTPGTTATCGPIFGNDVITDGFGNALTSYYLIGIFTVSNGIVASTPVVLQAYQFAGSGTFDLSSTLPFSLGPVSPAGSVLGQNLSFTGNNTHTGTETFSGPINLAASGGSLSGTFTGGPTATIANSPTGATESGNTVTITTTTVCTFTTGQAVFISGVGVAAYNNSAASAPNSWIVLSPGCNGGSSFTFTHSATGLAGSGGGTVVGSPVFSGNMSVPGLLTTGSGVNLPGITPINHSSACGTTASPITAFQLTGNQLGGGYTPCTYTFMSFGGLQTGPGFGQWANRVDLFTKAGQDNQSVGASGIFANCQGTNSGGFNNDNNTNCLGEVINAKAVGAGASVNPVALDALAQSDYTGSGTHTVQASQLLTSAARVPVWANNPNGDYSSGQTNLIQGGSQNLTLGFGIDSSAAGKGWLFGEYVASTIQVGHAILHGLTTPNTGYWCGESTLYCHFIGAGLPFPVNGANAPVYANSPTYGEVLGEKLANSGQSNILAFFGTNAGTACTLLGSPTGATQSGSVNTYTCNAGIAGDFAVNSIAHITGVGVSGYNIDCVIQTVASPAFTCNTSNYNLAASGGGTVTASTRKAWTHYEASDGTFHVGFASPPSGNGTDQLIIDGTNGNVTLPVAASSLTAPNGLFSSVVRGTHQTNSANLSSTGNYRLASADSIGWRNNANGADILLSKTGAVSGNIPADTLNELAFGATEVTKLIPGSTGGIVGTTTNDNANAGSVGEYVQSVLATGSSVTLATGVTSNVTSISLTAGDWDVTGAVDFTFGATTSYTNLIGSVSSTSATIGGQDSKFDFETPAAVPTAGADATFSVPVVRFSLSGTTTVFLVAQGTFTVSTLKAYGTIRARRIR